MGILKAIKKEIRRSREERKRRVNRPYMKCDFDDGTRPVIFKIERIDYED